MAEFVTTSKSLALVSRITSTIDRVFDINGDTYFSATSHPSIGIKVDDPASVGELLVAGSIVTITPQDESDTFKITLEAKKKATTSRESNPSGSPTVSFYNARKQNTVVM